MTTPVVIAVATRTAWFVVAFVAVAACGGSSGPSGARPLGEPACRVLATSFSGDDGTFTACTFERPDLTLRCTMDSLGYELTTTWTTLDDVLVENRPLGRSSAVARSFGSDRCAYAERIEYDADGRPLFVETTPASTADCGNGEVTYTGWDGEGRPLEAVVTPGNAASCVDQPRTFAYDDLARTITATTDGRQSGCAARFVRETYDKDGLLAEVAVGPDGPRFVYRYTTLTTDRICPE